jgi:hypothetical protein
MAKAHGVSAEEQKRRERQRDDARETPAVGVDASDPLLDELGLTPEQVEDATRAIEVVNLDELLVETISVKIIENEAYDAEGYDDGGNKIKVRHFRPVVRQVELRADVPSSVQMVALGLRNMVANGATAEERIRGMVACVLAQWQLTEPDMTSKRLIQGLGAERITKLFTQLFSQASRP